MPQPYFVPVSPTCSRMTHSNGVVGSTSTLCDFPLMVSAAMKPTSPAHPPVSVRRQLARVEFQVGAVFTSARQGEPSGFEESQSSQSREREQCRRGNAD